MMKDRSKKMCGHGVSVIKEAMFVCYFLFYGYPCSKQENMVLQCPKSDGIRPTNDRHTSLCILQV